MAGSARSFLKAGSSVRVDELLRGMVVHNANDATVALAEGLAGSVEAILMDGKTGLKGGGADPRRPAYAIAV